ncbi:hypothetical protein [uncultured Lentilactobacillus sp.]|uniref:hypothetical protein n=1 Tax=uncultured Lentilactobacillus sp. TaxID=2805375 RepID=UPI00259309CA|nr:hypothetical protein [uncultured Lentilactobacillus sp.]
MILLTSLQQLAQDVSNIKWTIDIFTGVVIASLLGSGAAVGIQTWLNHSKEKKIKSSLNNLNAKIEEMNDALSVLAETITVLIGGRRYPVGIHLNWHDTLHAYRIAEKHIPADKVNYLRFLRSQVVADFCEDKGLPDSVITGATYLHEEKFHGYNINTSITFSDLKKQLLNRDTSFIEKAKDYKELQELKAFWEETK